MDEDEDVGKEEEVDELEEGEVSTEVQRVGDKPKDVARNLRFHAGTSLKLSKQVQARPKDSKAARTNTNSKKTSSRKL